MNTKFMYTDRHPYTLCKCWCVFVLYVVSGYNVSRAVLEALVRRYGDRDAKMPFDDFVIAMSKVITLIGNCGIMVLFTL